MLKDNLLIFKLNNLFKKSRCDDYYDTKNYKIYTREFVERYKEEYKNIYSVLKDKDKTLCIMYKKVARWYGECDNINFTMERIHIKSKLGSYMSGGCGIGASLLASLTSSGTFAYMTHYLEKINSVSLFIYCIIIAFFGIRILIREDDEVEMYNIFLDVLDNKSINGIDNKE